MKDAVDVLLDKVNEVGVCGDVAAEVKQAARDYDQAVRQLNASIGSMVGSGIGFGAAVISGLTCSALTGPETGGVSVPVCLGIALVGTIGGSVSLVSNASAMEALKEEVEDAENQLDKALDKLCACVSMFEPG